jgi:uncharacterized protein
MACDPLLVKGGREVSTPPISKVCDLGMDNVAPPMETGQVDTRNIQQEADHAKNPSDWSANVRRNLNPLRHTRDDSSEFASGELSMGRRNSSHLPMKKLLVIGLALMASWVLVAKEDISPDKRAEIEKMIRLTGMAKMMGQVISQRLASLKKQNPDLPEEFWTKTEKKMDPRELLDKFIPVYDKYFSIEDLKAANAFYESPAGQRILKAQPQLMKDCTTIGGDWGRKIGEQVAQELKLGQ